MMAMSAMMPVEGEKAQMVEAQPVEVGEHIIIKDGSLATTWYCAEVSRIERNWIEVKYYTTVTPSITDFDS